jgi:hypothetical protein
VVSPDDGLTIITAGGIALRTEVDAISTYGRATSGVKLIDLADDDVLVSMTIVSGTSPEERAWAVEQASPEELALAQPEILDNGSEELSEEELGELAESDVDDLNGEFEDALEDDESNGDGDEPFPDADDEPD